MQSAGPDITRDERSTRERILDAAEVAFVENGIEATSLRELTSRAGVNLAAVNYYFGSRQALVEAVFARRLRVLNAERLVELAQAEAAAKGRAVAPEHLVEAFLLPVLRMSRDRARGGDVFIKLLGRAYTEPSAAVRELLADEYAAVVERFKQALIASLPQIPEHELIWRIHFALGAMSYAIAGTDAVQLTASYQVREPDSIGSIMKRIVPFVVAGLTAPLPAAAGAGSERRAA